MVKRLMPIAAALAAALSLAACQDGQWSASSTRHLSPIPPATMALMSEKGMAKADPILIRSYKREAEMEVWKRGTNGQYALLKTFPICRWSGQLGPKVKQGDRQAPEGFYAVTPAQMNPNSSYYLSFDTGFPNAFDRANDRSGTYLMVHGTCSSAGCFAMTDEAVSEIYALARESFGAGQRAFQFQSYPFRMTPENFARFRHDPHMPFWKNLKEGADYFEALREEPRVGVCGKRYVFGGADAAAGSCRPQVEPLVAERREQDERAVADLVAKGTPAVRLVYEDGGGHESFRRALAAAGGATGDSLVVDGRLRRLGEVSRPDALAMGPREVPAGEPIARTLVAARPGRPVALAFAPTEGRTPTAAESAVAKSAMARQESAAPARPAPITVAAAGDDDPSIYQKILGRFVATPAPVPAAAPEPVPAAAPPARPAAKVPAPKGPANPQGASNPQAASNPQGASKPQASNPPIANPHGVAPRGADAAREVRPAASPVKPAAPQAGLARPGGAVAN